MSLVDELKTVPGFTGHIAYRKITDIEPPVWVYSVGVNGGITDVYAGAPHGDWTPEEVQEFIANVKLKSSPLNYTKESL